MANQVITFAKWLEANLIGEELLQKWNAFCTCSNDGDPDEIIFGSVTEAIEELGIEAAEAARMVFFGDVGNWFDAVCLNGYGNFETADCDRIDYNALADYLTAEKSELVEYWEEFCEFHAN